MRLKLKLQTLKGTILPFNYQYPLSPAIYKIIQRADRDFSEFLHNTGYGSGFRSFKLFFSDLRTPFTMQGDRMQLISEVAEFTVCFYLPLAAEKFVKGLFMNQNLEVADHLSGVIFKVIQVESLAEPDLNERSIHRRISLCLH